MANPAAPDRALKGCVAVVPTAVQRLAAGKHRAFPEDRTLDGAPVHPRAAQVGKVEHTPNSRSPGRCRRRTHRRNRRCRLPRRSRRRAGQASVGIGTEAPCGAQCGAEHRRGAAQRKGSGGEHGQEPEKRRILPAKVSSGKQKCAAFTVAALRTPPVSGPARPAPSRHPSR